MQAQKEFFLEKRQELLVEKSKLENIDYSEQVVAEVDEFKAEKAREIEQFGAQTKQKYADIKDKDIFKVECYIEFVDKELEKIKKKEQEDLAQQVATEGGV